MLRFIAIPKFVVQGSILMAAHTGYEAVRLVSLQGTHRTDPVIIRLFIRPSAVTPPCSCASSSSSSRRL